MTEDGIINEQQLVEKLREKAVSSIYIDQIETGKFEISVRLAKEVELRQLVTQRKNVRRWANLHRLVAHMNENYSNIPTIYLSIRSKDDDG